MGELLPLRGFISVHQCLSAVERSVLFAFFAVKIVFEFSRRGVVRPWPDCRSLLHVFAMSHSSHRFVIGAALLLFAALLPAAEPATNARLTSVQRLEPARLAA